MAYRGNRPDNSHKAASRPYGASGDGPQSGGQGTPDQRTKLSNKHSDALFRRGTKTDRTNISPPPMRGGIRL